MDRSATIKRDEGAAPRQVNNRIIIRPRDHAALPVLRVQPLRPVSRWPTIPRDRRRYAAAFERFQK